MLRDGRTMTMPRKFGTERCPACRLARCLVSGIACLVLPRAAHASGLLNPFVCDPHGQPELANVYAVDFNPAALGGMHGTNIVVDGALAFGYVAFDRTPPLSPSMSNTATSPNRAQYAATNTGPNTASSQGFIPFLGASSDFGSRTFFAGIAAYAPFGGSIKWQPASRWANNAAFPGAVDGPQRWQSISVVDTSTAVTAAFGARFFDDCLSFGIALSAYSHQVQLDKAFNSDGTDDVTGPTGLLKEGRVYLNVSGVNYGASAGAYVVPDEERRLRLGASYTSQPGFGRMRLPGTLEQRLTTTPSGSTDVDLLQSYPDIVRLGAAYHVTDDVDLRLHGQYVRWSVFANACVVHRGQPCDLYPDGSAVTQGKIIANDRALFRDTGALHAGIGYWPQPRAEIFADLGFDTSAVPTSSEGRTLFDAFKGIGTVGLRYTFSPHVAVAASYTAVYYLPATVTYQAQWPSPSAQPYADGSYASHLQFIDANAAVSF
jgi:long-subunit fatty acid transport protein